MASDDVERLADRVIEHIECQPRHKQRAFVIIELQDALARARAEALREAADAANGPDLPRGEGDWLDGACDTIDWLRQRAERTENG